MQYLKSFLRVLIYRYALGGYDGTQMVSTVEIFDRRKGQWTPGKEMNIARGYAGAVVLGESMYVMGGMKDHVEVLDTVIWLFFSKSFSFITSFCVKKSSIIFISCSLIFICYNIS